MTTYRSSRPFLFAVAALILFAAAACGGDPGPGTVQGTVTQAKDATRPASDPSNAGAPLANAQIVVYGLANAEVSDTFTKGPIVLKTEADASGVYSFSLPAAKYVVEVWIEGLEVGNRLVEVSGGRTTTANLNVALP